MAKMNRKDYARQTERQMRDQMNSIVRNEDGSIYSIRGRLIDQIAKEAITE